MISTKLGYACLNITLKIKFRNVILKTLEKLSPDKRIEKLNSIALNNSTLIDEILKFNYKNDIGLYRIPANLLPFPTHHIAEKWNWREIFQPCFEHTGKFANENNLRLSFHADEYTIINTPHEHVFANSFNSLIYISDVLDMMKVDGNIVVHVGGVYNDKKSSLERFIVNFNKLPEHVRVKTVIENDDKLYGWSDIYYLCKILKLPLVLDIHHYKVYNPYNPLTKDDVKRIFSTWNGKKPKIHLSSPKNEKEIRSHANYVKIDDYLWFYELANQFEYDIMLEAKSKELAVLRFRDDLKIKHINI